ncbi:glycosyltransferase family 2 protein [Kribbella sp. NPDC048915]|uniref:glycosyltransferase n=1 Tax=Kribbella sp. NPDC048915 TaxID=3155148 RepID=UPI0033ECFB62
MSTSWLIVVPVLVLALLDTVAALRARGYGRKATINWYDDFTVLVPIYGDTLYLENVEYLKQYGNRIVLCTTGGESGEFYRALNAIAYQHGFRVFRSPSKVTTGVGQRATSGTTRDRVIRDALQIVTSEYVVMLDADSTTVRDFGELVGELHHERYDVASVRLVIRDESSWLVKLQRHEYALAMQLRFLAPWLVSGACHAGRTSAMRDVMARHSLFFQGNDIELGVIAKTIGYRVGHVPFEVLTSAPNTLRSWWRQRLAWTGGEFRLFVTNIRFVIWHPFFWLYGTVVAIGTFPLRWAAVIHPGLSLAAAAAVYYGLAIWLHWRSRDRWMLLMPLYTLFSSLVLTPIGGWSYLRMVLKHRNAGVIRPQLRLARHALS